MESVMEVELSTLGWDPSFEEEWQRSSSPGQVPARIAAEHRGAYDAWAAEGSGWSRVAGRLRHGHETLPGVGTAATEWSQAARCAAPSRQGS